MAFTGSTAHVGGAIYVEDNPFTYCIFEDWIKASVWEACFFQFSEEKCDHEAGMSSDFLYLYDKDYNGTSIIFENNAAVESGSSLYGE